MEVPIDIEAGLAEAIRSAGIEASGTPLPETFGLPHALVACVGGQRTALVRDEFGVEVDVRHTGYEEACATASEVVGVLASLQGGLIGGRQCYEVSIDELPYSNPDPSHADVARVTLAARVAVRARSI